MKKLYATACLMGFLIAPLNTKAEPGPTVSWLMAEPASLFDIGMIKLDIRLQRIRGTFKMLKISDDATAFSSYDWDTNRIKIFINSMYGPFDKNRCAMGINAIRREARVAIKTQGYSVIAGYFAHEGYAQKGTPEKYKQKIDQIIDITFNMKDGTCKGALLSESIYYL